MKDIINKAIEANANIEKILTILNNHSGFDDWWYNLDEDTQLDIREEMLKSIIESWKKKI